MCTQTIIAERPRPTDRTGNPVATGSEIPRMRPRTGKRGTDKQLATLLDEALQNLANCDCAFWACDGPSKPRHMATCRKCWAMRAIATVAASLKAREATLAQIVEDMRHQRAADAQWLEENR